jgi:hypothetical protein
MTNYTQTLSLFAGAGTVLVDGATAIGTAKSQQFCTALPLSQNVNIEVNGTFTVCTADLERSTDGGTTWVAVTGQTAIDLAASKSWAFYVPMGLPHRLNLKTTFTGTSITVIGYVPQ